MSIATLARAALLGIERAGLPLADGERSALTRADDPALSLLQQAAWVTVCERAGALPPTPVLAESIVCPPERLPSINELSATVLLEILARADAGLIGECLTRIVECGRRLDERLLPRLLDELRAPAARAAVIAAGGEIGPWLARLNPAWAIALARDSDALWSEGSLPQRVEWLSAQRRLDADGAREQLRTVFAAEPPAARVELLAALAIGLSEADEPFLESVLDDRRKEVRRAAAALLQRLPTSRLCDRAYALTQPLLAFHAGGWLRKGNLEVRLPETCTAAMQRDGIDAKPPAGHSGGERSYWLEELLGRVPMQRWRSVAGLDAPALWALTRKHEFGDVLRRGWLRAAISSADYDFVDLALADGALAQLPGDLTELLAACVAQGPDAERRVAARLRAHPDEAVDWLLDRLPRPWSAAFSREFLGWLQPRWNTLAPKGRDYPLHGVLKIAAPALDAGLSIDESGWLSASDARLPRALTEFFAVHALRHRFLVSLQQDIRTP